MFDGFNRYVYAMYFSFALVSTIAFGDIVGKNYFEDVRKYAKLGVCDDSDHPVHHRNFTGHRANVHHLQKEKNKTALTIVTVKIGRNKVRFLSERLKGYREIP